MERCANTEALNKYMREQEAGEKAIEEFLNDNEAVIEALYETFIEGSFSGSIEIELDGFKFDVSIEDYFEELVEKAKQEMGEDYHEIAQEIEEIEIDNAIKKAERLTLKKQRGAKWVMKI